MERYTLIAQVSPVSLNTITVYNNVDKCVESIQNVSASELYSIMLATIEGYNITEVVFQGTECFAKGIGNKLNNVTNYNKLNIKYIM